MRKEHIEKKTKEKKSQPISISSSLFSQTLWEDSKDAPFTKGVRNALMWGQQMLEKFYDGSF